MGLISPTLPTVSAPRGSEEVDVLNALTTIVNAINGGLDGANFSAGAIGMTELAVTIQQALFTPGDLKPTALAAAPSGWLMCDGSAVSRTGATAALFAAIGTAYGVGDGVTTFNLPDLRGRTPVGVDGAAGRLAANDALGNSGGAETHTLTISQMPSHGHGSNTGSNNPSINHGHDFAGNVPRSTLGWSQGLITVGGTGGHAATLGTIDSFAATAGSGDLAHVHSISNEGGGGAHNNLQPYQVVNWLIKT